MSFFVVFKAEKRRNLNREKNARFLSNLQKNKNSDCQAAKGRGLGSSFFIFGYHFSKVGRNS